MTKGFITGFHIGEVDIGKHVGEGGEKAIADHVPVVDDSVGLSSDEAGSVDDVCFAVEDGFDDDRKFFGIVL